MLKKLLVGISTILLLLLLTSFTASGPLYVLAQGSDSDDDGIPDFDDDCPGQPGPESNFGCPYDPANDSDGDGITDDLDHCPNQSGPQWNEGCPEGTDPGNDEEEVFDSDGDGVEDEFDFCPNNPGPASSNGCPDSDGDGFNDNVDVCPLDPEDYNGYRDDDGCPEGHLDDDGDGIQNDLDECVDGPENFNGYQDDDGCPETPPEPQNTPPVVNPISVTTAQNTQVRFTITATDPDGPQENLSFNPQSQPQHGKLAFVPGTSIGKKIDYTYTPNTDYSGSDSFTIMAWDGKANSAVVTISITVNPASAPPAPTDTDGDGVPDSSDACPSEYGTQSNGCPQPDYGGYNSWDAYCKGEYGSEYYYDESEDACLLSYVDTDGDGVPDSSDACPSEYGTQSNGCPDTVGEIDELIQLGIQAGDAGDWDLAITYFEQALEIDPNRFDVLTGICVAYYQMGDYLSALNCLDDAYQLAPPEYQADILQFIEEAETAMAQLGVDSDDDGIPDELDDCPNEGGPEWNYGCPEAGVQTSSGISIKVGSNVVEYLTYITQGYVTDGGEPVSNQDVNVLFTDAQGNKVTEVTVKTNSDGFFWAKYGTGSYPGPHVLKVSHQGSQATKNVKVLSLGGQPACSVYKDQWGKDGFDLNIPIHDSNCFKMIYGDKVTHDGTVQYGQQIQFLAKSMRYNYPDRALIEIYNPCGKLVYEAPVQIATDGNFWPKVTPSGAGFDMSGVYEFVAYHENSGREILTTTFTVQAGGEHVSSPDHPLCTGQVSGELGETELGQGTWTGVLTGYGDFVVEGTDRLIYSIDGTFFFDIQDDGSVKGNGVGSMHISRSWGLVDNFGYEYSCWSIDNEYDKKSAAYQIAGEYSNNKVYIYPKDGSPDKFILTIWCDLPGFHQDTIGAWSPFTYGFDEDAVLELKKGAETSFRTNTPFADTSGKIDWKFKITEEGTIPSNLIASPPPPPTKPTAPPPPPPEPKPKTQQPDLKPVQPPKTPPKTAPVPIPTAPKVPDFPEQTPDSLKKICEDLGLRYNAITGKCFASQPQPTAPPTPPQPTPTPTPVIPITLSVTTDRPTYNQGNLVTINSEIFGNTETENIAISITDPLGNVVLSRTITIDDAGTISFKVSDGTLPGIYQVISTVTVDGQQYLKTTEFNVKKDLAGISIQSVMPSNQQGTSVTSFMKGSQAYIKVTLNVDSFHPDSLVTVNLMDSDLITLGTSSIRTSLNDGKPEMILSYFIPNDASEGTANIYVNVFSDWPSQGGTPLTRESSATITISGSGTT